MSDQTAKWTKIGFRGEKLYQKRARRAVPLLVRQAKAEKPIYYSDLAEELDMPNPRNLNYPLGAIGNELLSLGKGWGEEVPPLQALVINKESDLPGDGIAFFAPDAAAFERASKRQRREIVDRMLMKVYTYGRWEEVLDHFGFQPAETDPISAETVAKGYRGGGESDAHRAFKEFVAENPKSVGAPRVPGKIEYAFGSGDCVDVLFQSKGEWVGVEVKAANAPIPDVARGLFQCVKYLALLEATQQVHQIPLNSRLILALEGSLPPELVSLRNTLGVQVVENV